MEKTATQSSSLSAGGGGPASPPPVSRADPSPAAADSGLASPPPVSRADPSCGRRLPPMPGPLAYNSDAAQFCSLSPAAAGGGLVYPPPVSRTDPGCGRGLPPMPRPFKDISDASQFCSLSAAAGGGLASPPPVSRTDPSFSPGWGHHFPPIPRPFKPSRVPMRSNQPPSQPPRPIDPFRYKPRVSTTAGTSTASVVLSGPRPGDFDLGAVGQSRRAMKSKRGLKRPHHGPHSGASPSTGSFSHNPKPSKAAAASGVFDSPAYPPRNSSLGPNAKSQHVLKRPASVVFDSPAYPPRNSSLGSNAKRQHVLKRPEHRPHLQASSSAGSSRHSLKNSKAAATTGYDSEDDDLDLTPHHFKNPAPSSRTSLPHHAAGRRFVIGEDVEDDDGLNWSELEEVESDEDYNREISVFIREEDVVGLALRVSACISADLRKELYGSSARARNIESYSEIDASTCRIVTQEDVDAACTSKNSGFDPVLKQYQLGKALAEHFWLMKWVLGRECRSTSGSLPGFCVEKMGKRTQEVVPFIFNHHVSWNWKDCLLKGIKLLR